MNEIKKILQKSSYPDRAEYEWAEFEKRYRRDLGADLPQSPAMFQLATVFGQSFYLTSRLLNQPDLADRLSRSEFLDRPKPLDRYIDELKAAVEPIQEDRAMVARLLRHYRYEEMLRLTVRDTAELGSFEELGQERSDLAAACIEVAYQVVSNELIREYGQPVDGSESELSAFTVLGMGKLGGGDLNYSSDVDIIYFYSSDEGGFSRKGAEVTHHQYFVRLGEVMARLLSDRTEDGFVYRVDLDLRPEGSKGTLANSIDAMETYYESFGDNWERMALTKARTISGSLSLGEKFWHRVKSFVYPATTDYSTLEQIRDLKNRIEQSLQKRLTGGVDAKNPGYNVKLGIGGIREIEFFVGAFQRLYGGSQPVLQERNTLIAIERLVDRGLVANKDGQNLGQAYRFLRRVENRLQMLEERQTHSLPKSREDLVALARGMYPDDKDTTKAFDRFEEMLLLHTENVRAIFESFLGTS